MPIEGDYEPSTSGWVRDQVEAYERSGGQEANTLRDTGMPEVFAPCLAFEQETDFDTPHTLVIEAIKPSQIRH